MKVGDDEMTRSTLSLTRISATCVLPGLLLVVALGLAWWVGAMLDFRLTRTYYVLQERDAYSSAPFLTRLVLGHLHVRYSNTIQRLFLSLWLLLLLAFLVLRLRKAALSVRLTLFLACYQVFVTFTLLLGFILSDSAAMPALAKGYPLGQMAPERVVTPIAALVIDWTFRLLLLSAVGWAAYLCIRRASRVTPPLH